jgi:hypothetical protein
MLIPRFLEISSTLIIRNNDIQKGKRGMGAMGTCRFTIAWFAGLWV